MIAKGIFQVLFMVSFLLISTRFALANPGASILYQRTQEPEWRNHDVYTILNLKPKFLEEKKSNASKMMTVYEHGEYFFKNRKMDHIFFDAHHKRHHWKTCSDTDGPLNPPVAPEPLSAILFVVGGLMLGTRFYLRRKKTGIVS
jgi:hypothetical protein